jgi:hypothetical protein
VKEAEEAGGARIAETWNSFWGHLLLWRFHEDNPERWTGREKKADWVIRTLGLSPGARVYRHARISHPRLAARARGGQVGARVS